MNNEKTSYRATLSRTQGRKSWCVIFQHPLRRNANGKIGLRIRRGLNTDNETEARDLVDQLNTLLADPSFHNVASRERAALRFAPRVVDAFFSDLTPTQKDSWGVRDLHLPLPSRADGYAKVQFLGTTGVGKTTLVRQMLGTDPERERFPSTSPARTTICDFEAVLTDAPFRAVVSFISRELTVQHVEDNLQAAIQATIEGRPEDEIRRRFLTHAEQRFRLQYILGRIINPNEGEILEDEDEESEPEDVQAAEVSDTELSANSERLIQWLGRLHTLAQKLLSDAEAETELRYSTGSAPEKEFLQEWVEEYAPENSDFRDLLDEILQAIESRFDLLSKGRLERDGSDWPALWTWQTDSRRDFITAINRFSSNWAPNFGKLLTPLVDGIRVSGPFTPQWADSQTPKLVLMDGQGLGHTLDSASSVSTRITKRYDTADLILLVDTAAQPMQAAPFEVIKSLVSSGQEAKLAVCFTHFDDVKGDNLTNAEAKRAHVLSSLENAISEVGKILGRHAEAAVRHGLKERVFFVSNIQKELAPKAKATRQELGKLLQACIAEAPPPPATTLTPVYDVTNLVLVLQKALLDFHESWNARLGFRSAMDIPREPWQRLKALSKRLGVFGEDEYDSLRPVADLNKFLREGILGFIAGPVRWEPNGALDDELRMAKLSEIARELAGRLQELSAQRIFIERGPDWTAAYSLRGYGSTATRAQQIRTIYDAGAPIPSAKADPQTTEFMDRVKSLVRQAIETAGGKIN